MTKITARDIQVFVAGVLAYIGFESLVWTPDAIIHSHSSFAAVSFIVGVIALPLAVGIVAGSRRAILWTQVICWLCIIQDVVSIFVFVLAKFGISLRVAHMTLYRSIGSLLTLSALLLLIALSRSKRFGGDRTPNTALEPTATAPSILNR
ncbi:MAG: hypothetical protein ABSD77_08680 [Verrucomicrobiota bacterium]|jgi:hypothetical protein